MDKIALTLATDVYAHEEEGLSELNSYNRAVVGVVETANILMGLYEKETGVYQKNLYLWHIVRLLAQLKEISTNKTELAEINIEKITASIESLGKILGENPFDIESENSTDKTIGDLITAFRKFYRESSFTVKDEAMAVVLEKAQDDPSVGGINLNPAGLEMKEIGDNIEFDASVVDLENLDPDSILGIQPIIINITPVTNFQMLLGIKKEDQEDSSKPDQLAKSF